MSLNLNTNMDVLEVGANSNESIGPESNTINSNASLVGKPAKSLPWKQVGILLGMEVGKYMSL